MNKIAKKGNIILLILLAISVFIIIYVSSTQQQVNADQQRIINDLNAKLGIKDTPGFVNKIESGASFYYGKAVYYLSSTFGFKSNGFWVTLWDFISDYSLGFLAGLFLWAMNMLIIFSSRFSSMSTTYSAGMQKQKASWLYAIAGAPWKIFMIGFFYAIVMQIPLINRFFDIITFKVLGVSPIFRVIIFSFWIGFGPAAIEWYGRYRLRKKYYKQLMEVKYGVKVAKAMSSG